MRDLTIQNLILNKDGGVTVSGAITKGWLSPNQGFVCRYDKNENILWAKSIVHEGDSAFIIVDKSFELNDETTFIMGRSNNAADTLENLFLAKLDKHGNLTWQKLYSIPFLGRSKGSLLIRSQQIFEDDEKNVYISFHTQNPGFSFIAKLSKQGDLIWSRAFGFNKEFGALSTFSGLFLNGDKLELFGIYEGAIYMSLNKNTGEIGDLKHFKNNDPDINIYFELQSPIVSTRTNQNEIIIGAWINASGYSSQGLKFQIFKFDATFSKVESYAIKAFSSLNPRREFIIDSLGNLTFNFQSFNENFFLGRITSSGEIKSQKKIIFNDVKKQSAFKMLELNNHGNFRLVYPYSDVVTQGLDMWNLNLNKLPSSACFSFKDTSFITKLQIPIKLNSFSWEKIVDNVLVEIDFKTIAVPIGFENEQSCSLVSICDEIAIKGEDSVCINNSIRYTASTNAECLKNIHWNIDDSALEFINNINDTTIEIKFKREWEGFLYASVNDCSIVDSIKIHAYSGLNNIDLGRDTTFCEGDSLVLNFIGNYSSYLWNNGYTGKEIIIKESGEYNVKAIFQNGCYETGSITVHPLYNKPNFAFPDLSILCIGQNDSLRIDQGFKKYEWHDGSNENAYHVKLPGKYWVTVTNEKGCFDSDTINILKLTEAPEKFIVRDTTLCSSQVIKLAPVREYNSYLWNNRSVQHNIMINQPGIYSLTVVDENNCSGIEYINVKSRECKNNLIFPSAFSPNGDGINDLFKPIYNGNVIQYRLEIYNRWGQIVFKNDDPAKGWDGNAFQQPIFNNSFIWLCSFKFDGESTQTIKGSVIVVK